MGAKAIKGKDITPDYLLELKPGRKYIFVLLFKGRLTQEEFYSIHKRLQGFIEKLKPQGFDLEGLLLDGDIDLKVIEKQ